MSQQQAASVGNKEQAGSKPVKKKDKSQPFLFDYIPIVDATALANLFDELRVETNGKLVHPQWKHFRHMKMIRNDRTRLSNAIWRSWFLQMKQSKKPLFCQFHVDVLLREHQVPQAVPIEGKYWKRRSEAVATEYKKWRLYYKQKRMFNQRRVQQNVTGDLPSANDVDDLEGTSSNHAGASSNSAYYFFGDELQDIPDNFLNTQLPYLLGAADRMMDTADTYQPSLDNLNPYPFIDQLMDDTWMDIQNLPKAPLEQPVTTAVPMYFKSSPRHIPFVNDPGMSYGMMLPEERYGNQGKPREEMTTVDDSGASGGPSNSHVSSDSSLIKTEALASTGDTELKDSMPFPRRSSSNELSAAMSAAPPTMQQTQPAMPQYTGPVFQGLLDPKAQYHKSLAEQTRMERAQRKQQESNKQQQLYIQLLQQYSNQLPEATRPQAEMLQTVLSDPNMVDMLQHIFKGQQQEQQPAPPVAVTMPSPVQRTPPLSAPPIYSSGPSSSSPAINQAMFQYQSSSGKDLSQASPDVFTAEGSKPAKPVTPEERKMYKEVRRQSHISAEQKRRGNIKAGLDQLHILISRIDPSSQNQSKMSKANVLMKSVDYIQRVHSRRESIDAEIASLQAQVQQLNNAINRLQEQLPASGAASGVSGRQYQENQQRFTQYVCERSTQNYRFWIFSLMAQSLFDSYNSMVSTGNMNEFCRTAIAWSTQQCSLVALRPVVQDGLRKISQTTSILTQPAKLPQQLIDLIQEQIEKHQTNMDSST